MQTFSLCYLVSAIMDVVKHGNKYTQRLTTTLSPSYRVSAALFWLLRAPACLQYTETQGHSHKKMNKEIQCKKNSASSKSHGLPFCKLIYSQLKAMILMNIKKLLFINKLYKLTIICDTLALIGKIFIQVEGIYSLPMYNWKINYAHFIEFYKESV